MAADELPFMSFAVDKWLTDTSHLTDQEYATLHRLICHAWRRGGMLPNDAAALGRMVGASSEQLTQIAGAFTQWLEKSADGRSLIAPEVQRERQRALELRDKKRAGGIKGNRKRWGNKSHTDSDSDSHSDSHTDSDSVSQNDRPSPSPSPSPDTPPSPYRAHSPSGSGEERTHAIGKDSRDERKRKARLLLSSTPDIDNAKVEQMYALTAKEVAAIRRDVRNCA